MRSPALVIGLLAAGAVVAPPLAAAPRSVRGTVTNHATRATPHGLITEVSVRTGAGVVRYSQLGGRHGGIREHVFHAPPLPAIGATVEVELAPRQTRLGDARLTLTRLSSASRTLSPPLVPPGRLPLASGLTPESTGFVRGLSTAGNPWRWPSSCVFITYGKPEGRRQPTDGQLRILDGALDAWELGSADCSSLSFVREGPAAVDVFPDWETVIVFREERWCTPATDDTPEVCHRPGEIALTHVRFIDDGSDRDGEIVDADIELNAVSTTFTGDPRAPTGGQTDLASVVTHEIGHVLGLAHTCLMPDDDVRATDAVGNQRQSCFDPELPESLRRATMYGTYGRQDTWMATPESVDVAGVCAIYPAGATRCERPGPDRVDAGCGCRVPGGATTPPLPAALGLGLAGALLVRRRRRGRT